MIINVPYDAVLLYSTASYHNAPPRAPIRVDLCRTSHPNTAETPSCALSFLIRVVQVQATSNQQLDLGRQSELFRQVPSCALTPRGDCCRVSYCCEPGSTTVVPTTAHDGAILERVRLTLH